MQTYLSNPSSSGQDLNYLLISWYTRLVANRKANKNPIPSKMAPPFTSCLAFVFLTGHPGEESFLSLLKNTALNTEGDALVLKMHRK